MASEQSLKTEVLRLLDQASEADLQAVLTVLRPIPLQSTVVPAPHPLDVEDLGKVGFNILQIAESIGGIGTFMSVAHTISDSYDFYSILHCEKDVFARFLQEIGVGYRENPYHNSLHAADVSQSIHIMLVKGEIPRLSAMTALSTAALFLSAFVHDYGHPGVNNKYLVKSGHELALRYNDFSPLENYHLAQTFAIMRKQECAVLKGLSDEERTVIRSQMIKNVLATDMDLHFKIIDDAKGIVSDRSQQTNQFLVQPILLHYADIANVMKPPEIMMQWGHWVNEEFFRQSELECSHHLPPSFPFTRATASITKNQKFFIEVLALPLFLPMTEIWPGLEELLEVIRGNVEYLAKIED